MDETVLPPVAYVWGPWSHELNSRNFLRRKL